MENLNLYTTNPDNPSDTAGVHTYYLNIIHAMPNNVYWLDRNCVTLGCNENVLKLVGLKSYDEFIGITYEQMGKLAGWVHGEAASFYRDDMEVMESGKPKLNVEEPPVYDKNGKPSYYISSRVPLKDKADNVIGVIGISVDITTEKEAEAIASEKRLETMRVMGMSIAHELRTPLRAISSGAECIANKLPTLLAMYKEAKAKGIQVPEGYPSLYPSDIELLGRVLHNIEQETKAAFAVIDMLLIKGNLTKIDKEKFNVCEISDCIRDALKRYPFQADEKKLIECKRGEFTFRGNALLIVHVLFNFIKNSLYYVKRAGKGSIQIWIENNNDNNKLHFKDTGTGISPDNLSHIFEQFFSTESNGTGIGLAFCKFAMESMNGSIECFSKEGEYTEFVLTFPKMNEENIQG